MNLEACFKLYPLSKIIVIGPPVAYELLNHRFLASITALGKHFLLCTGPKYIEEKDGYPIKTLMPRLHSWAYLGMAVTLEVHS